MLRNELIEIFTFGRKESLLKVPILKPSKYPFLNQPFMQRQVLPQHKPSKTHRGDAMN